MQKHSEYYDQKQQLNYTIFFEFVLCTKCDRLQILQCLMKLNAQAEQD